MSPRSVVVTGIGGSIGIDIARSLRADPALRIIGCDADPWALRQTESLVDRSVALPRADRQPDAFFASLAQLASDESACFAFINPDPELEAYAASAPSLPCPSSLPSPALTAICLDKEATLRRVAAPSLFPATRAIDSEDDVDRAFAELGTPLWLRARVGPGGRGSLHVQDADEARAWMRYWNRRGKGYAWVLHEFLPGANINWTGLFVGGELVACAAMKRLRYFLGDNTASGVSGQVSRCATVDAAPYTELASRAVASLDSRVSGVFSVDLRHDASGQARITEINPRLAGRPYLYARAGGNIALAVVHALTGQGIGEDMQQMRLGLQMSRQLDIEPIIAMEDAL